MNNESRYFSVSSIEHLSRWAWFGNQKQTILISCAFDTVVRDAAWHRMTLEPAQNMRFSVSFYTANTKRVRLTDGTPCDLDTFIDNPLLSAEEKTRVLDEADFWSREYDNAADISLHEFTGRYLWLRLKLRGDISIPHIRLYYPQHSFIRYLPESMQTGDASFFARFAAIFQSLYLDLDAKIEHFHTQLNPASASLPSLEQLAQWLGLEPLLPLSESTLRVLVSEAWELVPAWGTRKALSRVLEILCGRKPYIREHCEKDPFSFTVLLTDAAEIHTVRRTIETVKPAHTSYTLVVLKHSVMLNANVYIGVNSRLTDYTPLRMDSDTALGLHRLGNRGERM